eukprot:gnl/TRDRNA2_/TRDRNA2_27643_c0_seq1.p1 gnl/TRDRNA2_/TRDRNA2_27643_c0~~gnl/TRDRNA2_/TRDRNA2_27643_c0_seq1.p1  ORF type:complete len:396 (+),score=42.55 gnl/TRDRNA2_/TRDRNA2_27643_c0_seq1:1-1188(+)
MYLSVNYPAVPRPPPHRFTIWKQIENSEKSPKRRRTHNTDDTERADFDEGGRTEAWSIQDDLTPLYRQVEGCNHSEHCSDSPRYCYVLRAFCDDDFDPDLDMDGLEKLDEYSLTEFFRCGFFIRNKYCISRIEYDPLEVYPDLCDSDVLEHKLIMFFVADGGGGYCLYNSGWLADVAESLVWTYLDMPTTKFENEFDVVAVHTLLRFYCKEDDYEHVARLTSVLTRRRGSDDFVAGVLNRTHWRRDSEVFDTPLMRACWSGGVKLVSFLLACGADPNVALEFDSPLKSALCGSNKLEVVKLLLQCEGIYVSAGVLDMARSNLYDNEVDNNPERDLAIFEMLLEKIPEDRMSQDIREERQALRSPDGRAQILRQAAIPGRVMFEEAMWLRESMEKD